jgi:hypothetical protein
LSLFVPAFIWMIVDVDSQLNNAWTFDMIYDTSLLGTRYEVPELRMNDSNGSRNDETGFEIQVG